MENFKGNSNASKEETIPEKKLEPITSNVTVKKEPKLKNKFFAEDAKSAGSYVFTDVIIPGIQRLVSDSVKNAIDWLIYGKKGNSGRVGPGTVSYSSYYDRNRPSAISPSIPASAYASKNTIYAVNDVYFDDRGSAEEVLIRLREEIDRYGMVSVADFYDLISQHHSYTDCKYGWRDLVQAEVVRNRDGYSISFPKAGPLE